MIDRFCLVGLVFQLSIVLTNPGLRAQELNPRAGCWPQEYSVVEDDSDGTLTLATPYYSVSHSLIQGGAIFEIRYTHGRVVNLLKSPVVTALHLDSGVSCSDLYDTAPLITHERSGKFVKVRITARLLEKSGTDTGLRTITTYDYRWGYIKIEKEIHLPDDPVRITRLSVLSATLDPSLSDYGYRQGIVEQAGANPFGFGVCQWRKMRAGTHFDPPLQTRFVPRYLVFANHGIEGIEWFVGSKLSQWDYQLTGSPGNGQCYVGASVEPHGISVSVDPINLVRGSAELHGTYLFDYYIGMPILEGHANRPWLHRAFNRNKGQWISEGMIREWSEAGIKTLHCHNDGDVHDDGIFWRDGTYPPYPPEDMRKYDEVIELCHKYGIRVATYFSNKELHSVADAFRQYGELWGRKPDDQGRLKHNRYRGDEFGAQMCLRSGWSDQLKANIDEVLRKHDLDGVYYDWNLALYCNNPRHVGESSNLVSGEEGWGALAISPTGHWDMDELIEFMEWTRERVGPEGLVILHNTMAPMFTTENFANYVVGMEWGYGKLLRDVPPIAELPLEWDFAGARPRGVIGYGTIAENAPQYLHQLLALETLLTGVAPWPATDEALDLYRMLRPLGEIERYRFEDCRNSAITLDSEGCSFAVYSRPDECYIVVGNFEGRPVSVNCVVNPNKLPWPMSEITSAEYLRENKWQSLRAEALTSGGKKLTIPPRAAILLHVR
jgi:hypothetical protein